jgi:hypothetical protein
MFRLYINTKNKNVEQANSFHCLGNLTSYEKEVDIDKLNTYFEITRTINNMFRRQKTLKKTRIKLYNILALPAVVFGCEKWTIKARDARKVTAAEMKYKRKTAGFTCTDHKQTRRLQKN